MPYYEDWESLVAAAEENCTKILERDVRPVVERILKQHISDDIYGVYYPKLNGWVNGTTYHRRYTLLEPLYHEMQEGGKTLMVTSTATPSPSVVPGYSFHNRRPGAFLKLLETGNMGIWVYGFPRPAVGKAQKEIDHQMGSTSSEIGSAIQSGLDRYFN